MGNVTTAKEKQVWRNKQKAWTTYEQENLLHIFFHHSDSFLLQAAEPTQVDRNQFNRQLLTAYCQGTVVLCVKIQT